MHFYRLLVVLYIAIIQGVLSAHFRGALVMVRPHPGGSPKEMQISYYISWKGSTAPGSRCSSSTVGNDTLVQGEGNIACLYGCSSIITEMTFYCTEFSNVDNWSFGSRSLMYNFSMFSEGVITIGTASGDWIVPFNDDWNISTTFNLTPRNDTGQINSSPHAISLPLRLQSGCYHTIPMAVSDPDGDVVHCRWAVGDECGSVCNAIPGAVLNYATCTITYQANTGIGYKAVAVMVEDFIPGSTEPLSSVAFQFLVLVVSSSQPCSRKPKFVAPTPPSGYCLPGKTFVIQLVAYSGSSHLSIQEIQAASLIGTTKGELRQISNTRNYAVNISWTPLTSQQNMIHHLCYLAVNSDGVASEQSCIQLAAGFSSIYPISESHLFNRSNITLHIRFNKIIQRSPSTAFLLFYESVSDQEMYRIDASSSSEVTFDDSMTLTVKPNFSFIQGTSYYLGFERGVVWRYAECAGNEPVFNKTYLAFEIEVTTAVPSPGLSVTTVIHSPVTTAVPSPGLSGGSGGSSDDTVAIIGAVVGGICGAIVVVVVIVIVVYCCWCRKDDKKSDTIAMSSIPPPCDTVLSDKVQMDTNPAYAVSTTGTVKMEDNPAYQTMTTNSGGGAGYECNYYEDVIFDQNVKMTQNPAYAVP